MDNKPKVITFMLISAFAFIGALLIIKPQFNFLVLPPPLGFISAMCAGAAYTLIRCLRDREKASTIVFYFSFVSVVSMLKKKLKINKKTITTSRRSILEL
ncbi:hypothetical protein K2F40_14265 [Clostridium sp. CM028]|uniref:hypothetical protein n=1 Tax=unclassified Clostridium TaxID=2614128 RepID=UPI001C0B57CE|nr:MULTISPECIES: hypothetical protein [unclassified Clostridium]MBU3093153.1 hypothetical protein [Clostridium sp. CF011]MBW9147083.1 hypothetical protein [Clostridium sp. CM027]MBW9150123.1 hypothetical protein [Clostridium sp. CM028]UVE39569.1 hypothetical protein KTC92_09950 [Clostridium sp. CM027]WAG68474.1 hypothetical protein LL036_10185 [Clostridium sp. CF011]